MIVRLFIFFPLMLLLSSCVVFVPFIKPDSGTEISSHRGISGTVFYTYDAPLRRRPSSERKMTMLIRQLDHPDDVVRTHAAADLGMMGPSAEAAVPNLSRALRNDSSKWVRRASARSLGRIGSRAALEPLRAAVNDRDKWVAHSAGEALAHIQGSGRSLSSSSAAGAAAGIPVAVRVPDAGQGRGGIVPSFVGRGGKINRNY